MKMSGTIDCISGADECVSSWVLGERHAEPSGKADNSSSSRLAIIARPAQRSPLISLGCGLSRRPITDVYETADTAVYHFTRTGFAFPVYKKGRRKRGDGRGCVAQRQYYEVGMRYDPYRITPPVMIEKQTTTTSSASSMESIAMSNAAPIRVAHSQKVLGS